MTENKSTAHANAQRAYHERQKEKGLVKLSVYVPKAEREAFYDALDLLRMQWQKKGHDV